MAKLSTNEIRPGSKLLVDNVPCSVVVNEAIKPGKGQAFNRIRMKNIQTGRVIERTYKSGESIDAADVQEVELQFLYTDGEHFIFMDPENYEQVYVPIQVMDDVALWVKEQDICVITLWDDKPIGVLPPMFVTRRVVECEPAVRGDTVTGVMKNAVIETGATVKVPLFVSLDDLIRVDTRTGEYVSRVKDEA